MSKSRRVATNGIHALNGLHGQASRMNQCEDWFYGQVLNV